MRSRAALLHPTLHTAAMYVYIHSADNAIWPPNRICEEPGGCAQHSQVVVATLFLLESLRGHFAFLSVGVTRNLVLLLVMGTAALEYAATDGILLEKFCST